MVVRQRHWYQDRQNRNRPNACDSILGQLPRVISCKAKRIPQGRNDERSVAHSKPCPGVLDTSVLLMRAGARRVHQLAVGPGAGLLQRRTYSGGRCAQPQVLELVKCCVFLARSARAYECEKGWGDPGLEWRTFVHVSPAVPRSRDTRPDNMYSDQRVTGDLGF